MSARSENQSAAACDGNDTAVSSAADLLTLEKTWICSLTDGQARYVRAMQALVDHGREALTPSFVLIYHGRD